MIYKKDYKSMNQINSDIETLNEKIHVKEFLANIHNQYFIYANNNTMIWFIYNFNFCLLIY